MPGVRAAHGRGGRARRPPPGDRPADDTSRSFWKLHGRDRSGRLRGSRPRGRCARRSSAEGVGCEVGYPSLSRDPLFQPSLSRLPVPTQYPERLDVAEMAFPVADRAGSLESIYLDENVFRAGADGVGDAVEAIAKVQRLMPDARRSIWPTGATGRRDRECYDGPRSRRATRDRRSRTPARSVHAISVR